MPRSPDISFRFKTRPLTTAVAKAIKQFSLERRNLIRGIVADAQRGELHNSRINDLRNNGLEQDMLAAAKILEGPGGLRERSIRSLTQEQVSGTHSIIPRTARLETVYACGFLNCWLSDSIAVLKGLRDLSELVGVQGAEAVSRISVFARDWGASNYLSRKIAFAKELLELSANDEQQLRDLDRELGHDSHPFLQFSALENIKERVSLFSVARRHTNLFKNQSHSDFRSSHSLNNLVATPLSDDDCAGFLLRAVETSLVDTAFSLLVILNLDQRFPTVVQTIRDRLAPELLAEFEQLIGALAVVDPPDLLSRDCLRNEKVDGADEYFEDRSLTIYRRSATFLENAKLCEFRNDIDRVVGHRLIAPLIPPITEWFGADFSNVNMLRRENGRFTLCSHDADNAEVDTFYRTYLFLRLVQNPQNLAALSSDDVKQVFDRTARLETLLLEEELKTMHLNASDEARAIISVLALSMYRSKSSDPDVDFDFRKQLEQFIIGNHKGSVAEFVESLAPESPEVANYLVGALDEVTLQKMYSIVKSQAAAENTRKVLLMTVGQRMNKIEYVIEAESIETRSKVAKLKDYFDGSRMFVDSIAMKKWLDSHPSAYTEQYKEHLPKLTARLSRSSIISSTGEETKVDVLELMRTDQYLLEHIFAEAFTEFCENTEFGIESYLGRRIRHNTLHGVLTNSVDAVLKRSDYAPVIVGTPFGRALTEWESGFRIFIERMRRDYLQFKSDSKPNALFKSQIDVLDPATHRNLTQLANTLRVAGAEMLNELIVSYCWLQIAPQLEAASRQIRVGMAREMIQTLDQTLSRFSGPEEQKIKASLEANLASVFMEVAGWFQVPQTGFVPASISEICKIIDLEHYGQASITVVDGDSLGAKYYGISVHRIYDCLAVLLQNAYRHGREGAEVRVRVNREAIQGTNLHSLQIYVTSVLPEVGSEECVARVNVAVASSDAGADMVTEGYSGIKKVKFITRLNEGESTVVFNRFGDAIEIGFQLKAELMGGEA